MQPLIRPMTKAMRLATAGLGLATAAGLGACTGPHDATTPPTSAATTSPASAPATASPTSAATTSPATTPAALTYDRPAAFGVVSSSVSVPARDGTPLACMLFRPATGTAPAAGRFPVILSDFWPYYGNYLKPSDNLNASYFAQRGYADLVCALRGTYTSGGTFPGWFMPGEITDDYDIIEWAARQPWSDGRVGQEGASYGGIDTLRAAASTPPHLVAIAPQFAFNDAYLGYFYPGGIPDDPSQSPAVGVSDSRGVTVAQQNATWAAHPFDDAFWHAASVPAGKVRVPTLMVGGWLDYMLVGDIANYDALPRATTWLVMGPWEHGVVPTPTLHAMLLAWFDHWLKRIPAAALPAEHVLSFEMPQQGGTGWTTSAAYPPSGATPMHFALATDRTLTTTPGAAGTRAYTVNPHDGPAAICFPPGGGPCDPTRDFASVDAARLTFTSAPMPSARVLVGSIAVHLRAALSASDTNFVVRVMDVAPDGSVHQASVGYLKASHYQSQSYASRITPGAMTNFDIATWPMDWRVAAGHRLRISLSGGDSPKIAADAPAGTVTIATGAGGSWIDVEALLGR